MLHEATSERTVSYAGHITTDLRANLHPEVVCEFVLVQSGAKVFGYPERETTMAYHISRRDLAEERKAAAGSSVPEEQRTSKDSS